MSVTSVLSYDNFQELVKSKSAICFYLSTPDCNVCKVLKPKVIEMIERDFPRLDFYYIDLTEAKEISGQLSVFTVPTILIYFEGKETIRVSRNIHIDELRNQISRYYNMIFE